MFSIVVVQTKVISCNSANKSCLLQVVHPKDIAALTQFCDFYVSCFNFVSKSQMLKNHNDHFCNNYELICFLWCTNIRKNILHLQNDIFLIAGQHCWTRRFLFLMNAQGQKTSALPHSVKSRLYLAKSMYIEMNLLLHEYQKS